MDLEDVKSRGLVLLGCGKMGSALLRGWIDAGLPASVVGVLDPSPPDWLESAGVTLNAEPQSAPAVVLLAVKPQMMAEALPRVARWKGGKTLYLSVAAGTPISFYESVLGAETPVVRAMPNTPAAVSRGITAIVGNAAAGPAHLALAEALLSAVGEVVRLDNEGQIDAVTGVSGSGPAYVFHLVEALALAGEAQGLPPELAMKLARATIVGAGELLRQSDKSAEQLRIDVTSPKGTTAEALEVLMSEEDGFPVLLCRAVGAAADRSRELSR
ncbi:pyrroline-5-carboxylate reductase [Tropicimonas sp. IMCC34043]|uniref:pyrroline-5-carboxylate reductase n=1 Tax=Tropicimonas sp. IMCC34043 TaxID=2248760 RepID=UPI000E23BBCB|nr:pyrroline-5-carboxylate reductase [Tropicimonas sp. IMCC34043]